MNSGNVWKYEERGLKTWIEFCNLKMREHPQQVDYSGNILWTCLCVCFANPFWVEIVILANVSWVRPQQKITPPIQLKSERLANPRQSLLFQTYHGLGWLQLQTSKFQDFTGPRTICSASDWIHSCQAPAPAVWWASQISQKEHQIPMP